MTDTPRYAYDQEPTIKTGDHVQLPARKPPKGGYPPKAKPRHRMPDITPTDFNQVARRHKDKLKEEGDRKYGN